VRDATVRVPTPQPGNFVFTVLGLRSEQKAGLRGRKTVCTFLADDETLLDLISLSTINSTYTSFIAHFDPTMCPLGALAILLHFLHNEKYDSDYKKNVSWRSVRIRRHHPFVTSTNICVTL
jgi:hypothetical protein